MNDSGCRKVSFVMWGVLLYFAFSLLSELLSGSLTGSFIYAAIAENERQGIQMLLIMVLPLLPVSLYFIALEHKTRGCSLKSYMTDLFRSKRRMPFSRLLALFVVVFFIQYVYGLLFSVLELIFQGAGLTLSQSASLTTRFDTSVSMFLYACLAGPLTEEILYRGFVLKGFENNGKLFSVLTASLVFGLMHCDIPQLLFAILIGVLLGAVTLEYGILWAFIIHIFNNLILGECWPLFLGLFEEKTAGLIYWIVSLPVTVFSLIYCYRNRRRIIGWLRGNRPKPGTFRSWFCVPMILFVVLCFILMILQVKTVQ